MADDQSDSTAGVKGNPLIGHGQVACGNQVLMTARGIRPQGTSQPLVFLPFWDLRSRIHTSISEEDIQDPYVFQPAIETLTVEWNHGVCGVAYDDSSILVVIRLRLVVVRAERRVQDGRGG